MAPGDSAIAALSVALGGTALAWAAWRAAASLVGLDPLDRSLAATVLALAGLCGVLLVLGVAGLLYRVPVTVALVCVALIARRSLPEVDGGTQVLSVPARLVLGAGVAVACVGMTLGLQGTTDSVDTVQYHAVNAGSWLAAHDLRTLPVAVPGFAGNAYPGDHTLTGLWLMLATGSDQLVYTVNVVWGALSLLAASTLCRALGGSPARGACGALAVIVTPLAFSTQANSLLNDLAVAGALLTGAAAMVRATQTSRPGRWAVVGGLGLGLAAGSKYPVLPVAAAALLLAPALSGGRGWRIAASATAVALPLVLFWLVRNVIAFGNPLFPAQLGPLSGWSSPIRSFNTTLATHLLDGQGEILSRWLGFVRTFLGPVALVPVFVLATGAWAWRRRLRAQALMAGFALLAFALYLVTPSSGGGPQGETIVLASGLRYALPALLLGATVMASSGRWVWFWAAPAVLWGCVRLAGGADTRPDLDVSPAQVLVGALLGAGAAVLVARWPRRARGGPVLVALAVAVAGALVTQRRQPPTATDRLAARGCLTGPVGVVRAVDARALMGRTFDVGLVAVDLPAAEGRRPILDATALDRRVAALGVDVVAVSTGVGPTVPVGWPGPTGWREAEREGLTRLLVPPRSECAH